MANQNNDIAKHKQPEKKLKIEKESVEHYLDIAGVIIVALNNKGEITLLNKKGYEVLQYEEGELLGKNWFETCLPDRMREEVFGVFKTLIRGEPDPIEFFENLVLTKNGEERLISWHNSSLFDDEGNIIGILSSGEDITERKRVETALKESEERLKEGQRVANYGNWDWNIETNELFWSDQIYMIFGVQPQKIRATYETFLMSVHPDDREFVKKSVNDALSKKKPYAIDHRVVLPDGSVRVVHEKAKVFYDKSGEPNRMLGTVQDITERKQAEKEIKKSKQILEDITQGIKENILLLSKDLKILMANKAVLEVYGYKLEDIIGKYCYEVTHHRKRPCEPPLDPCPIYNTQKTDPSQPLIHTHFDQEGNKIFAEISVYPLKDEQGEIVQFVHISRDVTKRKLMEDSLKTSEEKYRSLFEESRDAIYIVTREGKFVDINDSMLKTVGYSREEMLELNAQELYVNPADRSAFQQEIEKKGSVIDFTVKFHKKDGTEIDCLLTSTKWGVDEKDFLGYQGILRDVTDKKLLEESLRKRTHDLGERVKELNCLYGISKLVEKQDILMEKTLQMAVDLIPSGWQYPEITCARIIINDQEFRTENFRDTIWKQTSDIIMDSDRNGTVEVCYLEEKPELDDGPFVKEERHLIDALTEQLRRYISQKKAEEELKDSEERFRFIFDHANDGMLIADQEARKFFMGNKRICQMLGYAPEEIKKLGVTDIHPKEHLPYVIEQFEKQMREEITLASEIPVERKDGSVFYADINSSPIILGGKTYLMGIFRDISERKQLEEKIKEYTESLEEMVEERTLDLRESEEKFRTLAEQSPSMIFINKKGKIVYANKRCEELMGYTKEDFYSPDFDFLSLMTPESIEIVKSSFDKHMADEEVESYEYTLVTKDGKRIEAIMSSRLINYEGETAILGLVTDITERKRFEETLHESETRYRGLYDSSMDGIVSADMEGKFMDCNQAFADMLGYTQDELCNLSYPDVSPSKWHELNYRIITEQVIPRGFSDEVEMEGIKKNGEIFPISLRLWLTKDKEGKPTGMWSIVRDISERKKLDKMKAEFIDLAAHELRTPLGALKAHVELLKIKSDHGYWTLPKEVHNKINIITRNAKRLTTLINNLVDYTRIEAGKVKLNLKLASIEEIVSQVIKEAVPLAQRNEHKLTFDAPKPLPLIHVDEEIVGAILNNVISNAIKYTPEGGAIDVMILEEEDNLHITVKDTGIGIAEEDLEKIFRPFYVVDLSQSVLFQSKSEFERSGMGLAVAKEYVNMLGGKIWAESPVGGGSIFHILFPKK